MQGNRLKAMTLAMLLAVFSCTAAMGQTSAGSVWGVGITVVNMLLGNPINPINCGAIAMVGGFPVVLLVSLLTPKLPREQVDRMFECY